MHHNCWLWWIYIQCFFLWKASLMVPIDLLWALTLVCPNRFQIKMIDSDEFARESVCFCSAFIWWIHLETLERFTINGHLASSHHHAWTKDWRPNMTTVMLQRAAYHVYNLSHELLFRGTMKKCFFQMISYQLDWNISTRLHEPPTRLGDGAKNASNQINNKVYTIGIVEINFPQQHQGIIRIYHFHQSFNIQDDR